MRRARWRAFLFKRSHPAQQRGRCLAVVHGAAVSRRMCWRTLSSAGSSNFSPTAPFSWWSCAAEKGKARTEKEATKITRARLTSSAVAPWIAGQWGQGGITGCHNDARRRELFRSRAENLKTRLSDRQSENLRPTTNVKTLTTSGQRVPFSFRSSRSWALQQSACLKCMFQK